MNDLIKVTANEEGNNVVDARELHQFLESKQDFSNWVKSRLLKYSFSENYDYSIILSNRSDGKAGKPRKNYILTLDTAKQLAMLENNTKGQEARMYFIEVEKKAKQFAQQLSPAQILYQQAQMMLEQERVNKETQERLRLLEAKTTTVVDDYFTITGWARYKGVNLTRPKAQSLGKAAARLSKVQNVEISRVKSENYGYIGSYHTSILKQLQF